MIYYDPTEARSNSRLPQEVIRQSQALPGLERATGADLLLVPFRGPTLTEVTDALPHQITLRRMCDGGMLVQRKTGLDLIASIPKLAETIFRMREWCDNSWLLFVGDLKASRQGEAIIDGRKTKWSYRAVKAATRKWQWRGGYYETVSRDGLIAGWLGGSLDGLRSVASDPVKTVIRRVPQEIMRGPSQASTLATLPGVGPKKAMELMRACGSLARALEYLSDPDALSYYYVRGIGKGIIRGVRRYMKVEDGNVLAVIGRKEEWNE